MQLHPNEVHIWSTNLVLTPAQEQAKHALLRADEVTRANRFRFAIHRQRYIAARAALRQILGQYLCVPPETIELGYSEHNKPFLLHPKKTHITFNLAHSENRAVYALTLDHAIGVDIEKIQDQYNPDIAERYFHPQEKSDLEQLSGINQIKAFYRIWSRKEAILKACGKGLSYPLSAFKVAAQDVSELIQLEDKTWTLLPLAIHEAFQSAVASNQTIQTLSFWELFANGSCHQRDV